MALLAADRRFCLFEDSRPAPDTKFLGSAGLLLRGPSQSVIAYTTEDVRQALGTIEQATKDGAYAGGFVAYEAASAFDPSLKVKPGAPGLPLLAFELYESAERLDAQALETLWQDEAMRQPTADITSLEPAIEKQAYLSKVAAIQRYLAAGDIYQANLTFQLALETCGHSAALYALLRRSQPSAYSAFLRLGDTQVLSLSPELFFQRQGTVITAKPMKGTLSTSDDNTAAMLSSDPKNRAENLMITDLLRNDLSRISTPGSVQVQDMFKVQRLPSVFQMTSTVTAHVARETSLADIFAALFPCGSVTGAPKIRAMEIIEDLEVGPRGVYCGAIGLVLPGGDASFSVPIRTLVDTGAATQLNVGSGIVADSVPADEYDECLLKARFATQRPPQFSLLESMALTVEDGVQPALPYWHLHFQRLSTSANTLGFRAPESQPLFSKAHQLARTLAPGQYKLRLVYDRRGNDSLTAQPITPRPADAPMRIRLGRLPALAPEEQLCLHHKTTNRWFYDAALAEAKAAGPCDDVMLVDGDGFVQEGSYTNVFVKDDQGLVTPPANGTLLPGILRQSLLAKGEAREAPISVETLETAKAVFVGNSVRGLMPAVLCDK